MKRNENDWNLSNLIWEQHGGNEMESFMTVLLLDPYFKING